MSNFNKTAAAKRYRNHKASVSISKVVNTLSMSWIVDDVLVVATNNGVTSIDQSWCPNDRRRMEMNQPTAAMPIAIEANGQISTHQGLNHALMSDSVVVAAGSVK